MQYDEIVYDVIWWKSQTQPKRQTQSYQPWQLSNFIR